MHYKPFVKLIGPVYNKKAMPEVISRLVGAHQYIAFYRAEDLENNIRMVCFNKGWNEEFTVAIHGDIELTTSSGIKFGSCLIVPDTTPEQLAALIERGLRMKAFL
jgi:hypothetical protein